MHDWCLDLIQQNFISEFERLLEHANEKSVYHKWIKVLFIEVYKYLRDLRIMNTIFKLRQILAQIVLHTELVSFGEMFPTK